MHRHKRYNATYTFRQCHDVIDNDVLYHTNHRMLEKNAMETLQGIKKNGWNDAKMFQIWNA